MLNAAYLAGEAVTIRLTLVLLAVWCLLTTLEWLANLFLFRDDALLSWSVLRLRSGHAHHGEVGTFVFSQHGIRIALTLRFVAAVMLVVNPVTLLSVAALGIIAVTNWLLIERSWIGADGSDQMGQIVTAGALLSAFGVAVNDHYVVLAGMVLIAGQLTLAFAVAGIAKIVSRTWRSGSAIRLIMDTHTYGHPLATRLFGVNPGFSLVVCWTVMLGEIAFPVALFMPKPVLITALVFMCLFQIGNAYFMGLNTFVWSFASAYPATYIVNTAIRGG
ncbi:MAG: hypothetical protein M3N13_07120 [Candidatus Eremiobacteraeota bacterium]|nr:hypothetical protein [Candidatus Eremiobacteraeota bacterium]